MVAAGADVVGGFVVGDAGLVVGPAFTAESVVAVSWRDRQAVVVGAPDAAAHARQCVCRITGLSGAAVSAVAKWLGHDPAVLLRVYGHVYPEALEAAGAALFDDETEETGT
ncbi:hypothetical protein AB0E01_33320 [Nocardia vinacea]|uniref:hypothetical protein n=1 Tax=Nocardia vinacea TaxID=96468 RepID=UPI003406CC66